MTVATELPVGHYKRHHDDEWFDEVHIECVERWKESELSGDEWRFSYEVTVSRKGQVLIRRGFSKLVWAIQHLPAILAANMAPCGNDDDKKFEDLNYCAQPGCRNEGSIVYQLKKEYCSSGHASDPHRPVYIRFCLDHKRRGDCGLEDADNNYEQVTP